MATTDDLARLDTIIRPLACVMFETVTGEFGGVEDWSAAVLDVRYSSRAGSFVHKVRVELSDGHLASLSLPVAATYHLIELGQARPAGKDRWFGFRFRITSAGNCKGEFNYDPACADDPSFFES
jgi:hypothetical protein